MALAHPRTPNRRPGPGSWTLKVPESGQRWGETASALQCQGPSEWALRPLVFRAPDQDPRPTLGGASSAPQDKAGKANGPRPGDLDPGPRGLRFQPALGESQTRSGFQGPNLPACPRFRTKATGQNNAGAELGPRSGDLGPPGSRETRQRRRPT